MTRYILSATLLALSLPLAASAETTEQFGTKKEARTLAEALVTIVDDQGIAAATEAVLDPAQQFRKSRMGVNLFHNGMVIADNREPETVAADYTQTPDLTGDLVWPRITAAADAGGEDAMLLWYHYDTQEEYMYHCFSLRAHRDDGMVMVCR